MLLYIKKHRFKNIHFWFLINLSSNDSISRSICASSFGLNANGFIDIAFCDPPHLFMGLLEGLSFIERMIYEKIENLGYPLGDTLYSMGGGTNSDVWMRIRATVLNKRVQKASVTETAFGSCVIAAGGVFYGTLTEAIVRMVRMKRTFEPDLNDRSCYEETYHRFVSECRARNLF